MNEQREVSDQEKIEALEKKVDALFQVTGRLLYETTSRRVVPFATNDELVEILVAAFPNEQEATDGQ